MFPRLERFLLGPKFACIEAEIRADVILYHVSVLQRKGSKAETVVMKKNISDTAALLKVIDRKIPCVLIVTGKGIINRKINGQIGMSDQALIRIVLPNANADELLISRYQITANTLLVSLARKDFVLNIADSLSDISLVSVLVGSSIALTLAEEEMQLMEWSCGNHVFRFQDCELQEAVYQIRSEHPQVQIGNKRFPGVNLVSFAGALQGLTHTAVIPGEVSGFAERRRNFIRMKRYGAAVKSSVLLMLLVLLINLFLFTHFRELKEKLESDPRIGSHAREEYDQLSDRVAANKQFLEASGWSAPTSHAWIADKLAAEMPGDIMLTRLNLAPANNFNREDTLAFSAERVFIAGTCNESSSLNAWLKVLQQLSWIAAAEITAYTNTGDQNKFELELQIQ